MLKKKKRRVAKIDKTRKEFKRVLSPKRKKGERFGKLTLVRLSESHLNEERQPTTWNSQFVWDCICECGKETKATEHNLEWMFRKCCGCEDGRLHEGTNYGDLTVRGRYDVRDEKLYFKKTEMTLCYCKCGKRILLHKDDILHGLVIHCGCKGNLEVNFIDEECLVDEERRKSRNYPVEEGQISYATFRKRVLERDNSTCVICGYKYKEKYDIVVHHLDAYFSYPERRTDVENGVSLCKKCHNKFHRKYGKRDNTEEQFKEFYKNIKNKEFTQKVYVKKKKSK